MRKYKVESLSILPLKRDVMSDYRTFLRMEKGLESRDRPPRFVTFENGSRIEFAENQGHVEMLWDGRIPFVKQ